MQGNARGIELPEAQLDIGVTHAGVLLSFPYHGQVAKREGQVDLRAIEL